MKKYYCTFCNDDKSRLDIVKSDMISDHNHFFYVPQYRCRKCGNIIDKLSKDVLHEAIGNASRADCFSRKLSKHEADMYWIIPTIRELQIQKDAILEMLKAKAQEVKENDVQDG